MPAASIAKPASTRAALTFLFIGNVMIGSGVLAPAAMINSMTESLAVSTVDIGALIGWGAVILCIGSRIPRDLPVPGLVSQGFIAAAGFFVVAALADSLRKETETKALGMMKEIVDNAKVNANKEAKKTEPVPTGGAAFHEKKASNAKTYNISSSKKAKMNKKKNH